MKKQSGFTLVEIMIAIAVTMIALAAAFMLFRDSTRANNGVSPRRERLAARRAQPDRSGPDPDWHGYSDGRNLDSEYGERRRVQRRQAC